LDANIILNRLITGHKMHILEVKLAVTRLEQGNLLLKAFQTGVGENRVISNYDKLKEFARETTNFKRLEMDEKEIMDELKKVFGDNERWRFIVS